MEIIATDLPEVKLIKPAVFGDERGFFMETWNQQRYHQAGLAVDFKQDNVSLSRYGVLRGLHLQDPFSQGKLVQVLQGEVFDVAVDVRHNSKQFGQWVGESLSETNKHQLYIPPGFAHGFCVVSDMALFVYKCTEVYHADAEYTISWNDPDIGIEWPVTDPELSIKDQQGISLKEYQQNAFA